MTYIGTRDRVEKLEGSGPPTESQRMFIENLLQDFPDTKDLDEYKDYHTYLRHRLYPDLCCIRCQRPRSRRA